jgi:uncharacterized membrane protein
VRAEVIDDQSGDPDEHYFLEFSDGAMPPPTYARRYEDISPGTFNRVFVQAYLDERKLIREEAEYRRERDRELRTQAAQDTEQERRMSERLIMRGQLFGLVAFGILVTFCLVVVIVALLTGQSSVAISALALLGGGILAGVISAFHRGDERNGRADRAQPNQSVEKPAADEKALAETSSDRE